MCRSGLREDMQHQVVPGREHGPYGKTAPYAGPASFQMLDWEHQRKIGALEYGLNNLFLYSEEYCIRVKEFLYPNTVLGILDVLKRLEI